MKYIFTALYKCIDIWLYLSYNVEKSKEECNLNNFDYIFKYNNVNPKLKPIKFTNKRNIICQIDSYYFGAGVINQVISFVKNLNASLKGFPIVFYFRNKIKINDKLSYILFECICYYLIENGYTVYVKIDYEHDIRTRGVECSPMNLLTVGNCSKFINKFRNELYDNHYCRLITEAEKEKTDYLSLIYTDIDNFLRNVGINDSKREDLSETISELIGNACEHTTSDCYIDIDVTNANYYKNIDNYGIDISTKYYGVNIVILNFSDKLLNDGIKEKIKFNIPNVERYMKLLEAYNYHKKHFDDNYTEDDFFNFAVFQNKISGSKRKEKVGGVGLTHLINSLQKKSDNDDCYVFSGHNILLFNRDYLSYNNDWIGFNKSNNFFTDIPDIKLIDRSKMFFAGTAYNLNFVMKSEDDNE